MLLLFLMLFSFLHLHGFPWPWHWNRKTLGGSMSLLSYWQFLCLEGSKVYRGWL